MENYSSRHDPNGFVFIFRYRADCRKSTVYTDSIYIPNSNFFGVTANEWR